MLFGRVNPSGHLPVTFPRSIDQLPRPEQHDPATTTSNPNMERIGEIFEVSYDIEGSDVGYRWFEREQRIPDYPFGWGLSYTTFAFSGLRVTAGGSDISVSGTLTNTGDRSGAAVIQVYVSRGTLSGKDADDFVPRLAAFERVHLEAGESRAVELHLEPRLLARWDVDAGAFRVAAASTRSAWARTPSTKTAPAAPSTLKPHSCADGSARRTGSTAPPARLTQGQFMSSKVRIPALRTLDDFEIVAVSSRTKRRPPTASPRSSRSDTRSTPIRTSSPTLTSTWW